MALQFADNHLDIFHPGTYNLQTKDGITASDVPLPAFISGLWMRLTGARAPWVFRVFTLLVCMAGFMRLFLAMRAQGDIQAALWTMLCWFLPTLLYFQAGFIPSVWALSAQLFGISALFRYSGNTSVKSWAWALAWITLAALLRKPHVLYLALMPVVLYRTRSWRREGMLWLAAMALWGGWQLWDRHLMSAYGSLFLRQIMPPASASEMLRLVPAILGKWIGNWFAWGHLGAILLAFGLILRGKKTEKMLFRPRLFLIWCMAGIVYFMLMLRQFWDHDYYVLDSFYPVFLVLVVWLNARLHFPKWALWVMAVLVGLCAFQGVAVYREFFKDKGFTASERTNQTYYNSREWVQRYVPADSTVMVFEAYSFNRVLIAIDRRGYSLLSSKKEAQENVLARQPAFALCLDTFLVSEVLQDNPDIASRLERVADNGLIHLFKVLPKPRASSPAALLGIAPEREKTFQLHDSEDEFLAAQTLPPGAGQVIWYGNFSSPAPVNLKATAALFKDGQLQWIAEQPIRLPASSTPVFKAAKINIPGVPADELRCYLWNPDKKMLSFDGKFGH